MSATGREDAAGQKLPLPKVSSYGPFISQKPWLSNRYFDSARHDKEETGIFAWKAFRPRQTNHCSDSKSWPGRGQFDGAAFGIAFALQAAFQELDEEGEFVARLDAQKLPRHGNDERTAPVGEQIGRPARG